MAKKWTVLQLRNAIAKLQEKIEKLNRKRIDALELAESLDSEIKALLGQAGESIKVPEKKKKAGRLKTIESDEQPKKRGRPKKKAGRPKKAGRTKKDTTSTQKPKKLGRPKKKAGRPTKKTTEPSGPPLKNWLLALSSRQESQSASKNS